MPDMFLAAARNDQEGVKSLLARDGLVDCRNFLSLTPLMLAATAGHQEMVDPLLGEGHEIEAPSIYGTAVTFAAMTAHRVAGGPDREEGANPNPYARGPDPS